MVIDFPSCGDSILWSCCRFAFVVRKEKVEEKSEKVKGANFSSKRGILGISEMMTSCSGMKDGNFRHDRRTDCEIELVTDLPTWAIRSSSSIVAANPSQKQVALHHCTAILDQDMLISFDLPTPCSLVGDKYHIRILTTNCVVTDPFFDRRITISRQTQKWLYCTAGVGGRCNANSIKSTIVEVNSPRLMYSGGGGWVGRVYRNPGTGAILRL